MPDAPLDHLHAHQGDFAAFRDKMIDTAPGRFGPFFWGLWDELVAPAPGDTVVDLGTGPGTLPGMLRRRMPAGRAIGVELQPAMLETARAAARREGWELVEADLSAELPLPAGAAGVVTLVMVLHELPFPVPVLAEAHRLLRPGGVLVLYEWSSRPLEDYLDGAELDPATLQHFREHCLFSPADLAFLCRRAGFAIREVVCRHGGDFSIVVAERPAG